MIQPDLFNVTPAPSVPCPPPAVKEGPGVAPNTELHTKAVQACSEHASRVRESGGCGRRPDHESAVARGAHDTASAADRHMRAVPETTPAREPAHARAEAPGPLVDGRGKRDTSRDAHRTLRDTGKLSAREREVYALLCRHPERNFTRAEIAKATGMTHGAACGRVHSLRDLGLIVETPRRRCGVTGAESHGLRCR